MRIVRAFSRRKAARYSSTLCGHGPATIGFPQPTPTDSSGGVKLSTCALSLRSARGSDLEIMGLSAASNTSRRPQQCFQGLQNWCHEFLAAERTDVVAVLDSLGEGQSANAENGSQRALPSCSNDLKFRCVWRFEAVLLRCRKKRILRLVATPGSCSSPQARSENALFIAEVQLSRTTRTG